MSQLSGSKREAGGNDRSSQGPVDVPGFARLGDLVSGALPEGSARSRSESHRVSLVWSEAMGVEAAKNSQPRHLRNGRLVVATESSAWAQALQDQGDQIIGRLNRLLGEEVVRSIIFRPAGWDPCAGRGAPRPLEAEPGSWSGRDDPGQTAGSDQPPRRSATRRSLSEEELEAVERARRAAPDPELGRLIAEAMRASLERRPEKE